MGASKYNYYAGFAPELFDLDKDPGEARNVADEPAYAAIRARLDQRLRTIVDPDATDARARAAQAALIARHGGPEAALNVGAPGATPAPV